MTIQTDAACTPLDPVTRPERGIALVYCDYVADRIAMTLKQFDHANPLIFSVGHVKSDLHPDGGYLLTTKKTVEITDRNGRRYKITVEEA